MKLALITDLHANREAVSAVLAHARLQGAERYAFLGDYVGYGADPGWVIDQVQALVARGAVAVMGNHDAAVVDGAQPTMIDEARHAVDWTREQLTSEQLAFLAERPLSAVDGEMQFVHATADEPALWRYITGAEMAERSLQASASRYVFSGHMHNPQLYHLGATARGARTGSLEPMQGRPMVLSQQHRWLAIPGSTGQPRDQNPAACYAIFEPDSATLTFHRVPYDVMTAARKVLAAGLGRWLAQRLIDGM